MEHTWKDNLVEHFQPKWDKEQADRKEAQRKAVEAAAEADRLRLLKLKQNFADKVSKLIMAPVDVNQIGYNPLHKLGVKLDGVVFVESQYERSYHTGGFGAYDDDKDEIKYETVEYLKVHIACPDCDREFTLPPETMPTTSENVAKLLKDYREHIASRHMQKVLF